MGRKYGEAATGDEFLEFLAVDHAREQNLVQVQFSRQGLEPGALGTVSRDDERSVWQPHHGAQELINAFLWRKPAEVKQVSFIGGEVFSAGQSLEVGQDFDALRRKSAGNQLVAHEFAGSEEHVHT